MRGKIIVEVLTIACLLNIATPGIISAQSISEVHYVMESSPLHLRFKKFDRYDVIRMDGARMTAELGKPMLPVKHIKMALPPGTRAVSVEVRSLDAREIPGDFFIMPGQPPRPVGQHKRAVSVQPDPSLYSSNAAYPGALAALAHQSNLAGQQIAHIAVYPVQYIPSQRKLQLHTSIELTVHCVADEGTENAFQERYYRFTESQHNLYENMVKAIVVNPECVHINPVSGQPSLFVPPGEFDHVIITSSTLASFFDPLVHWHKKKGMKDTVVTTDWIYANYTGTDDTIKIREFIIDANSTWGTMYFLMGGEGSDVPYAERLYYGDSSQVAPGDQYYSDFDDDWVHEVYVGRVSGDGETQISRFIDKVLKYEKDPPLTDYPLEILLIGMDLDDVTPAEDLKDSIASFIPGYSTINRVYDSDGGNHRDSIMHYLDAGPNLVNHMDHSNKTVMGAGYHNHGWLIDRTDVDNLTNDDQMSIITSGGCEPAAFDYDDCIGEHFVIYNDLQGAVAFIGNSRHGWYYQEDPYSLSNEIDLWFWHGVFTQGDDDLGQALVYAKHQFPQSDYDWEKACEWNVNLLGEPAMSIWTDTPAAMTVIHDSVVPDVPHDFIVTVMEDDGITPVESALVCCWIPDQTPEIYTAEYTDLSGDAALSISPENPDDSMFVTVTKHNYLPYEGLARVISVVPPLSPHVLSAAKIMNGIELMWNQITTDTLGRPEGVEYYDVYRSTTPVFIPDVSNSIGNVLYPDTVYRDTNALLTGESYYYLLKAVDASDNKSKKSNMAYVFQKFINENAGSTSDRNWVSLPFNSEYDSVKDITDDLSPSGDPISKITRLDQQTQNYYSWIYHPVLTWYGNDPVHNNFPIEQGVAYEMIGAHDDTVIFVGCNEPDGQIYLNENPDEAGDRNWISLPYNAVYDSVEDITDELSPMGDPVSKITMLDEDAQAYYSWIYHSVIHWYGNHPVTPNFPIQAGDGYEFIATKDTSWNPTEHSNGSSGEMLVWREHEKPAFELLRGALLVPDREPAWVVTETEKRGDHTNSEAYLPVTAHGERKIDARVPGVSHIVFADLFPEQYDDLVFTVYRPDRPYDVLTERSAGCVVVKQSDTYRLISFDVGNFMVPWRDREEAILIIEASRNGRGYYSVLSIMLDRRVDIQGLGEIALTPVPEVVVENGVVSWEEVTNKAVVGYSIYRDNKRLNDRVITERTYSVQGEVDVRLVLKGGHETVYGSQGIQSTRDAQLPMAYSFNIFPNPFVIQTQIAYAVPHQTAVELEIYDVSGRRVRTLVDEVHRPGYYTKVWHGTDEKGRKVASGVYFIKFETDTFTAQDEVLLVR